MLMWYFEPEVWLRLNWIELAEREGIGATEEELTETGAEEVVVVLYTRSGTPVL